MIRLLVLDVDGVLTDGRLSFVSGQEPAKVFCVRDGLALKKWAAAGGQSAVITGRSEGAVRTRAKEIGIDHLMLGNPRKGDALRDLLARISVGSGEVAYIGDDEPDIAAMRKCGLPIAVANAHPAVKRVATYVTRHAGGDSAVAEVVDHLLRLTAAS